MEAVTIPKLSNSAGFDEQNYFFIDRIISSQLSAILRHPRHQHLAADSLHELRLPSNWYYQTGTIQLVLTVLSP